MKLLIATVAIGVGATLLMDLWGLLRQPLMGMARPDYALVGRWIGHMPRGQFRHAAIGKAVPIAGEQLLGWLAHYLIGIAFAALLVVIGGESWLRGPEPGLALTVGLATVLAPFLLMQPGMGAGFAASRTANPGAARLQSLLTHAVFGLGLYVSAWIAAHLCPIGLCD